MMVKREEGVKRCRGLGEALPGQGMKGVERLQREGRGRREGERRAG